MATDIDDENVYDALSDVHGGDDRWAYGTGFDDPLAGVDTTIASGVDAGELARTCLALGDDALIMSQRLAAWTSNAHELEDDVALANIALDLLGQARLLLTRAAVADPSLRPAAAPAHLPGEDALAYFRDAAQFRNVRLAELDDVGDFAECVARLFAFSSWRLALLDRRREHPDQVLAAIAAKAVTELTYHRDYAAGWVVRLGDGTEVSHDRMQLGLDWVWPYLDELFLDDSALRTGFDEIVADVLATATVSIPAVRAVPGPGGRDGVHTAELAPLLDTMQSFARANPDATW